MGSPLAIPIEPLGEQSECIIRIVDPVLPEHLIFRGSKKSFDHAVLFRCVGSDVHLKRRCASGPEVLPGTGFAQTPSAMP
jgi:hypothetical protein